MRWWGGARSEVKRGEAKRGDQARKVCIERNYHQFGGERKETSVTMKKNSEQRERAKEVVTTNKGHIRHFSGLLTLTTNYPELLITKTTIRSSSFAPALLSYPLLPSELENKVGALQDENDRLRRENEKLLSGFMEKDEGQRDADQFQMREVMPSAVRSR